MTKEIEQTEKTYSVKATRLDGSMEPYLIYDGWQSTNLKMIQATCDSCNKQWGREFKYEVIEN